MPLIIIALFGAAMWGVSRWLRRRDEGGDYDFGSSGPPGLRWFFDWRDSGNRQRPPE